MTIVITVLIHIYSIIYGIDPNLMLAIARTESNLNPDAVAKEVKGGKSYGLFQIRGRTATDLGFRGNQLELLDPGTNIWLAANYIQKCQIRYGKSLDSIACCYNAGLYRKDATCRAGQVKSYIRKVRSRYVKGT
jgi:soluble lytic murein transglycosylase-like protein